MSRTDYINRVQKGIEVYSAMEALEDKDKLFLTIEGVEKELYINALVYENADGSKRRYYSIGEDTIFGKSMNIDMEKSSKSFLVCYTYDLFNNETTQRIPFETITLK